MPEAFTDTGLWLDDLGRRLHNLGRRQRRLMKRREAGDKRSKDQALLDALIAELIAIDAESKDLGAAIAAEH